MRGAGTISQGTDLCYIRSGTLWTPHQSWNQSQITRSSFSIYAGQYDRIQLGRHQWPDVQSRRRYLSWSWLIGGRGWCLDISGNHWLTVCCHFQICRSHLSSFGWHHLWGGWTYWRGSQLSILLNWFESSSLCRRNLFESRWLMSSGHNIWCQTSFHSLIRAFRCISER